MVDREIRKAYVGGRCEIFGNAIKGEKILHFDFRGMYAQVMTDAVPSGNWTVIKEPRNFDTPGFYRISWTSDLSIPVLPIKREKLLFPNGRCTGTYWFEEIRLFRDMGGKVTNIHFGIITDRYDRSLQDFTQRLMEIRNLGGIYDKIGKLLINSFYGRLGLGSEFENMEIRHGVPQEGSYISLGDNTFVVKKTRTSGVKSNVGVAAAITSKGRIKLYRGFVDIVKAGGRLLYYDTDSIIAAFPENLDVEDRWLGEVFFDTTKNDTRVERAVFVAPKTYALTLRDVSKGRSQDIVKIKGIRHIDMTYEEFLANFNLNAKRSFNGYTFSKINLDASVIQNIKIIDFDNYDKRTWLENRTQTEAIIMDEG